MIGTSTDDSTSALIWFKSSYSSSGDGNDCVEIATAPDLVHVRDSKQADGPRLTLAPGTWAHFVAHTSAR